eukprot:404753_1
MAKALEKPTKTTYEMIKKITDPCDYGKFALGSWVIRESLKKKYPDPFATDIFELALKRWNFTPVQTNAWLKPYFEFTLHEHTIDNALFLFFLNDYEHAVATRDKSKR